MTPPFRYYLRVRYGECDAQKVVFNARYGDYVDLASSAAQLRAFRRRAAAQCAGQGAEESAEAGARRAVPSWIRQRITRSYRGQFSLARGVAFNSVLICLQFGRC